ncbi:hypothetical protein IAT38_002389 [Cryptococcus sp. DSM 104549]
MSLYKLMVVGYRPTYTILTFDPTTAKLKTLSSPPIKLISSSIPDPQKSTWVEVSSAKTEDGSQTLYSVPEKPSGGALAVSLKVTEEGEVEVTSEREFEGGPVHLHIMKDRSGIVISNFQGGTAILFPLLPSGLLSPDSTSTPLKFPFVYSGQTAPHKRQDAAYAHQCQEGEGGVLYVPDLGNDRVWVVGREGESGLEVKGWLQAPGGTGPRHCLLSQDGKYLYVLTELSSELIAFPLPASATLSSSSTPIEPLPNFRQSIIPPSVPSHLHLKLNAAQLWANPAYPHILYASNRLELELPAEEATGQPGDAVAIIELTPAGDAVVGVKHVRTGCNNIRGMRVSKDGKYVVVGGRKGGGVEVWSTGEGGVDWKLAGKEEKIDGVTDMAWL